MRETNAIEADIKKYLGKIKKELPYPARKKKEFATHMEKNIGCFLDENPNADIEAIIKEFGTPKQIIDSLISEASNSSFDTFVKKRRLVWGVIIAIIAIFAVVMIAISLAEFIENQNYREGYYVETIGYGSPTPLPSGSEVRVY